VTLGGGRLGSSELVVEGEGKKNRMTEGIRRVKHVENYSLD